MKRKSNEDKKNRIFNFKEDYKSVILTITIATILAPVFIYILFRFYGLFSFLQIGEYDFSESILLSDAINYFMVFLNTIAVSVLAYFSYNINRQQLDLLKNISDETTDLKVMSKILKIHFPIDEGNAVREKFNTLDDHSISKLFYTNPLEIVYPPDCSYLNFHIPIFIYNDGNTNTLIEEVGISVDGITDSYIWSSRIVKQEFRNGSVNINDNEEFAYELVEAHQTVNKIFKFSKIPNMFKPGSRFNIQVRVKTNKGIYDFNSSFVFEDLMVNYMSRVEELKNISGLVENIEVYSITDEREKNVSGVRKKVDQLFLENLKNPYLCKISNTKDVTMSGFTRH